MAGSGIFKLVLSIKAPNTIPVEGLSTYLVPLGCLEIIIAFLFTVPSTRLIGFYLSCSYWGGAIAVNMLSNKEASPAILILALFWIAIFIQDKTLFIPDPHKEHRN